MQQSRMEGFMFKNIDFYSRLTGIHLNNFDYKTKLTTKNCSTPPDS